MLFKNKTNPKNSWMGKMTPLAGLNCYCIFWSHLSNVFALLSLLGFINSLCLGTFFLECLQNSILKGISVFFCHKLYLQCKKKYEQSSYRLIHNSTRGRVSTNQCNAMLKIQKNKEKCRSSQKKYFQLSQLKLKMYT